MQHLRVHTLPAAVVTWENRSNAEIAQIERLKHACRRIDRYWEVECGSSDEGDPWCAVYDWRRYCPILHVARIDGIYVTVFPSRFLWASSSVSLCAANDAALSGLFGVLGRNPSKAAVFDKVASDRAGAPAAQHAQRSARLGG